MEKKVALYLDDIRTVYEDLPEYEWKIVRNYEEFITFIIQYYKENNKLPDLISFDHDLDDEHMDYYFSHRYEQIKYEEFKKKTGLHCAKWLTVLCEKNKIDLRNTKLVVHSHNPIGSTNIQNWLNFYLSKTYGNEHATCYVQRFKFKIEENEYIGHLLQEGSEPRVQEDK